MGAVGACIAFLTGVVCTMILRPLFSYLKRRKMRGMGRKHHLTPTLVMRDGVYRRVWKVPEQKLSVPQRRAS